MALAITPLRAESLYAQLCRVNAEWKSVTPDAALLRDTTFTDDAALIRTHLLLVEKNLRAASAADSNTRGLERAQLLDVLHTYALAGIFPKNTHHPDERRPYFIDDYGTHCAVGYLIMKSGHEDLAQKISADENYAYLRDITTDGLNKWQISSGFTVKELAWIQPAYNFDPRYIIEPSEPNDSALVTPVYGTSYFNDGALWYSGQGDNDILNGSWTQYYKNGKAYVCGNFKNGLKDGYWIVYDRNGKAKRKEYYRKGRLTLRPVFRAPQPPAGGRIDY